MSTYSARWINETMTRFLDKYSQGVGFLAHGLGIEKHLLIKKIEILLGNYRTQTTFERVKYVIKDLQKHVLPYDHLKKQFLQDVQYREFYLKYVKYLFDEAYLDGDLGRKYY